ncbi:hypothetical protein DFP72DRAFT_857783 [Ephemerocybe angulata]|uniref:Uncharacterized protein n=1 Tax=Ephemerocybe angulata TaxID=980116 RepID=A0A8H6HE90_9AGAR|nr:hypothetical protein DFP72DRAFT_857783 [Tulosesus angulatus]
MRSLPSQPSSPRTTVSVQHCDSFEVDDSTPVDPPQSTTPQQPVPRLGDCMPASCQLRSSSLCHARFPRSLMDEDERLSRQGHVGASPHAIPMGTKHLQLAFFRKAQRRIHCPHLHLKTLGHGPRWSASLRHPPPAPSALPSMHVPTEDVLLEPVYGLPQLVEGTRLPWSEGRLTSDEPGPTRFELEFVSVVIVVALVVVSVTHFSSRGRSSRRSS